MKAIIVSLVVLLSSFNGSADAVFRTVGKLVRPDRPAADPLTHTICPWTTWDCKYFPFFFLVVLTLILVTIALVCIYFDCHRALERWFHLDTDNYDVKYAPLIHQR